MAKPQRRMEKKQPEYGSDVIVDMMKAYDIEYAAFNPGASFRGIHDSIVNYGENHRPEVIFCCHEEISVALAHGYAKAKGKPMVAIAHDIVGLQHASMAIFNAWCDRVPVIVLGGTGPMDTNRRRPWIDWIHTALVQGNQVRDYVKWDDQPHGLGDVGDSFIRAYRLATTDPMAPVYICYDADLQENELKEAVDLPDVARYPVTAPLPAHPDSLKAAAALLVEARSPLVVADFLGRNPKAVKSLVELAELLGAAVMDKGNRFNFPNNHPLDATGSGDELLRAADVILALDVPDLFGSLITINRTTRLWEYVTRPDVKIIDISLKDLLVRSWVTDFQHTQPVDVAMAADTSVALPELSALCRELLAKDGGKKTAIESRRERIKKLHDRLRSRWLEEARASSKQSTIATAHLAHELGEAVKNEDWVLANGNANGWARKLWNWTKPYQYLGRSGGAGVGYGMGGALGVALAHLGSAKLCVDIQSDGDLLMTSSALWTAAHHKIPILIVMHNNRSFYNSEEHAIQMAKLRKRPVENAGIGTHVDNPAVNFAKVAEGFGVYG